MTILSCHSIHIIGHVFSGKRTMCHNFCHGQQTANTLHCLPAENIAMSDGNYYAQRPLHFTLGQNDPLYQTCFYQHSEAKRKPQQAVQDDRDKAEKKPREL